MYNLIEYNSNISEYWRQHYRNEQFLDGTNTIIDLPTNNNDSISFKFKDKARKQTGKDGTKDIKIMIPLLYLSRFWKTLEMSLINSEINLHQLSCSRKYFLVVGTALKSGAET